MRVPRRKTGDGGDGDKNVREVGEFIKERVGK